MKKQVRYIWENSDLQGGVKVFDPRKPDDIMIIGWRAKSQSELCYFCFHPFDGRYSWEKTGGAQFIAQLNALGIVPYTLPDCPEELFIGSDW